MILHGIGKPNGPSLIEVKHALLADDESGGRLIMPPTFWGLEIGTWAAWFSAVLTSGSLLLGFSILIRDRRERRRGQAKRIVVWGHHFSHLVLPRATGIRHPAVSLFISNSSDQPIVGTMILASNELTWHKDYYDEWPVAEPEPYPKSLTSIVHADPDPGIANGMAVLLPGEKHVSRHCFLAYPGKGQLYVMFRDAQSQVWIRDVASGKLKRARRFGKEYKSWKAQYTRSQREADMDKMNDEMGRAGSSGRDDEGNLLP